ncbi:hypothetical protein G6F31_016932 [Rhizopus arrhizus]|nr:hypothetical protein G6F31_016932 [Rhizopus arrhizus]
MEEFRAGVPARGAVAQHREGGEQHGEDQAVAHQIDPEPHRGLGSVVVVFLVRACGVAKGQMAHGLRGLLKAFITGVLDAFDFGGGNVEVHVAVIAAHHERDDDGNQAAHGHGPHVPDERKAQQQAPHRNRKAHRGARPDCFLSQCCSSDVISGVTAKL